MNVGRLDEGEFIMVNISEPVYLLEEKPWPNG